MTGQKSLSVTCIFAAIQVLCVSSIPKPHVPIPWQQMNPGEPAYWTDETSFKPYRQHINQLKGIEVDSIGSSKELQRNEDTNFGLTFSGPVEESLTSALDSTVGTSLDKIQLSGSLNRISNDLVQGGPNGMATNTINKQSKQNNQQYSQSVPNFNNEGNSVSSYSSSSSHNDRSVNYAHLNLPPGSLHSIVNNALLQMEISPNDGLKDPDQGSASGNGMESFQSGNGETPNSPNATIINVLQQMGFNQSTNGGEPSSVIGGEHDSKRLGSIVNNTLLLMGVNPGDVSPNEQGVSPVNGESPSQNNIQTASRPISSSAPQEVGMENNSGAQQGGSNITGQSTNPNGNGNNTELLQSIVNNTLLLMGLPPGDGFPNEEHSAPPVNGESPSPNNIIRATSTHVTNSVLQELGIKNSSNAPGGSNGNNQSTENNTKKLKSIVNNTLLQMGVNPSDGSPNEHGAPSFGGSSPFQMNIETASTNIANSVLQELGTSNDAPQGGYNGESQSTSPNGDGFPIPSHVFFTSAPKELDVGRPNGQALSTGDAGGFSTNGSKNILHSIENNTLLPMNVDQGNIMAYQDQESTSGEEDGSGSGDKCKECTECYGCFIPFSVLQTLKTPPCKEYCRSHPCQNNGTCIESRYGFSCVCPKGFKGYTCQDVNICDPNPCQHDGVCIEKQNNYTCLCKPGYKGARCQDDHPCGTDPCTNGGTCTDVNGTANCTCHPRYAGNYCEVPKVCYDDPCLNGATCKENQLSPCICAKGFTGRYCSGHVCAVNPCLNGGACEVAEASEGGDSRWTYTCRCPAFYKGKRCEVPHFCAINPCQNGGSCVELFESSDIVKRWVSMDPNAFFRCNCLQGYSGRQCEIDVCDSCDENAVCVDHRCVCSFGYRGDGFDCTKIPSPCRPNPCRNNGTCTMGPDLSYDCHCVKGYCGQHCDVICDICALKPCQNGGSCYRRGDDRYCVCPPEYTGPDCNIKIPDPCVPSPCLHEANCTSQPGRHDYRCDCPGKYSGKSCQDCDCSKAQVIPGKVTHDAKCDNYGDCYCEQIPGKAEVTYTESQGCVEGKTNRLCDPNPCLHGGTCKVGGNYSQEICHCASPYYGDRCQFLFCNISNPCQNGGSCIDVGVKNYTCKCTPRFTGVNCTEPVPEPKPETLCDPSPCINGGTCKERGNGYDCLCYDRFTGPNCEVDRCADCDINADCIQGHCMCRQGYEGTGYMCKPEESYECGVCPTHHQCISGQCVCTPYTTCSP